MLEIGTSGLMSGEGKRATGTAPLLDSTQAASARRKADRINEFSSPKRVRFGLVKLNV